MPCEGRCVEAYISGSQRPWLAVDAVIGVGSRVLGSTPQLCITELGGGISLHSSALQHKHKP